MPKRYMAAPKRLAATNTENQRKARLRAVAEEMPSGAKNSTMPPSRTPMPLRLTGKSVSSVTMGTTMPQ